MNELSREELEARRSKLDAVSRRNMERCAAFIAKMINKYGREVLAEIEAEEAASTTSVHSSDICHASGFPVSFVFFHVTSPFDLVAAQVCRA